MNSILEFFKQVTIKEIIKQDGLKWICLFLGTIFTITGTTEAHQYLSIIGYVFLFYVILSSNGCKTKNELKIFSLTIIYFYFVYSTYLGRDNWLGSRFYNCFNDSGLTIPIGWVLFILSWIFLFLVWWFAREYINIKKWLIIFISTTFFVLITWYPLSFISYYSGVESRLKNVSNLLYQTTNTILHSANSKTEKEIELKNLYKEVSLQAKLYKNDIPFIETDYSRLLIENSSNSNVVFQDKRPILVDNDIYKYSASSVYRPDVLRGILRAFTWSILPDRFGDDAILEKYGIEASSNEVYRGRRKAGRSMNWWLIFSLTYGLFCAAISFYQKQAIYAEIKLKKVIEDAERQYNNTGLYQELLFNQLTTEFNDIIVSKVKSHLQQYTGKIEKKRQRKVYSPSEENNIMESMQTNIGDAIHTLKNKWNQEVITNESNLEDNNFKLVNTILEDLKTLKTVFDLKYTNTSISELEEIVKSTIPANFSKIRTLEFTFNPLKAEYIKEELLASINKWRLKSIIGNLLQNSNNAIGNFRRNLPKEIKKNYKSKLSLSTNIEYKKNKAYYTICVEDNGGGFPESVLDKIYKEPITSSDYSQGKERKGSGTIYIGMFVKRMGGDIEAKNQKLNDGFIGAYTKIFIPLN